MEKIHNYHIGIFLIRITLGIIFIIHSLRIAQNLDATFALFANFGLSPSIVYAIGAVEFVGGVFLALGVLTSFAALLLAADMIFTFYTLRVGSPYYLDRTLELVLAGVSLGLIFLPTGSISFENAFDRSKLDHSITGNI